MAARCAPYDHYQWGYRTPINGQKKLGNWGYNPTYRGYKPTLWLENTHFQ